MRTRNDGFTLVELMVVVLIIGILVAIAVPVFNAAKANAEKSTCFANQRTLEGVYQQYKAATGAAPPTYASDYVAAGYLKTEPICPAWASDTVHHYTAAGGGSHNYYFYEPGTIWAYRPTKDNASINEGFRGCFTTTISHGYYRTPGVN